jgi:1-deoxy-D-xylulose 5-phosphate reductoisomerase
MEALASEEEVGRNTYNVYFRTQSGAIGAMIATNHVSHKKAILAVKEALVAGGDCLTNKAVLAVIEGGKNAN